MVQKVVLNISLETCKAWKVRGAMGVRKESVTDDGEAKTRRRRGRQRRDDDVGMTTAGEAARAGRRRSVGRRRARVR